MSKSVFELPVSVFADAELWFEQEQKSGDAVEATEAKSSEQGQLTCLTCGCVFQERSMQNAHYRSDWHRFNLKRKLAGNAFSR
jgi:hypothetical protein